MKTDVSRFGGRRVVRVLPIALLMLALATAAHAAGVDAALTPAEQTVASGSTFTVDFTALDAGDTFNGYTLIVGYDPSMLTFMPSSPLSLQEGSYMTGACGSTFHDFTQPSSSTLKIVDILLCGGTYLPGPGQLYHLTFKATGPTGVTDVNVQSVEFYHGGTYVTPVNTADAVIGIDVGPVGVPAPTRVTTLRVTGAPNPFRGEIQLAVDSPRSGFENLEVRDIQGRIVRHLQSGTFAAGTRSVTWNGRSDTGAPMSAGVYLVHLRTATGVADRRIIMLR